LFNAITFFPHCSPSLLFRLLFKGSDVLLELFN